jgi:hypothetical protein
MKNCITKSAALFAFASALFLFAGCSSTPTKVNTGSIKANSFSFVNTAGRPQPSYADQRAEVNKLIQDAITTDLARFQVTPVANGGDITVAYLVIVGNNATTTSINEYFGYGRDVSALNDIAHEKYTQNKNPNYFEAGTIVIDIIDSHTSKLLKRGYASRPLLANPTTEARAARIQQAVDEALQGLSITH